MKYMVLGIGKQGVAAAYDVIRYGGASHVTLADGAGASGQKVFSKFKKLVASELKKNQCSLSYRKIDARDRTSLKNVLQGHAGVLSALPYYLNLGVAQAALNARTNYCDLGGYFEVTRQILKMDARTKKAGVTLVPDCGVSPGMCNSLAVCGMERLDKVSDVSIYCGGLPRVPRPPLGYKVVFNLEGVLGNYLGKAYVLKNGKVTLLPPFSEREELDFGNSLGKLDAAVTGGATSTCPWTFRKTVKNYSYKTLRYPGHWEKIQTLNELGLLDVKPVEFNGHKIVPRAVFAAIASPRLNFPDDGDLLVMRVTVRGESDRKKAEVTYDVLEYNDPKTGFSAMQRTTGFSAAVILQMLAQGRIAQKGVVPVEKAVSGQTFLTEIRRRGIAVKEKFRILKEK